MRKLKLNFTKFLPKGWIYLFLFMLVGVGNLFAQTITGTVTDEANNPLFGATVLVKGERKGTSADENGRFTLENTTMGTTLMISYVGFIGKEVPVVSTELTVVLQEGAKLDEVTITAEKRETSLQKAPISVTAVQGTRLRDLGLTTVDQVLRDVPNIQVQGAARGFVVAIRGIGSDLPPGVGESSVSTNYDGIYNFRAEAGTLGLFDLERVEALRGPQATLYGRNATGGVVNFISRNPTDVLGGYALVEAGNYGLLRAEGAVNVPLGERLAVRTSFAGINRNGYLTNGQNDAVGMGIRTKLKYLFSDNTDIVLNYENNKLGGKGFGFTSIADYNSGNELLNNTTENQSQDYQSYKFWVDFNSEIGPGVLTLLPSYQVARGVVFGDNGMGLQRSEDPKEAIQTSMEARYASKPESKVNWVLGYYYYGLENNIAGFNGEGTDETKSSSFFGQVTLPLTNSFRAVAGLRYASDTKSFDFPSSMPPNGEKNWKTFDWKGGLELSLAENTLTYLTVASGHRAGGFNSFPGAGAASFDPEELLSYELGFKSLMAEGKVQINGALFYYDYKDFQVADFYFPPGSPFPVLEITNHDAINRGVELETRYALGSRTNLKFNFTYLKSTYEEDFDQNGGPGEPVLQMNGETLPHAPATTFNIGLDHTFVADNGLTVTPNLNYRKTAERYVAPYLGPNQLQEAFSIVDASLKIQSPNRKASFTAYARNAFSYVQKMAFFGNSVIPGAPIQWGFNMQYNF